MEKRVDGETETEETVVEALTKFVLNKRGRHMLRKISAAHKDE